MIYQHDVLLKEDDGILIVERFGYVLMETTYLHIITKSINLSGLAGRGFASKCPGYIHTRIIDVW